MQTLSFLFSIIGLAAVITSFMIKNAGMKKLLFLNAAGNGLMMLSYLCVGNMNGALTCGIGLTQGVINYFFAAKQKKLPVWLPILYALSFIAVNLTVYTSPVDLIAIVAALTAVILISASSGKVYRRWALINNCLWCVFDLLRASWGPLVSHLVLSATSFAGIVRNDFGKKTEHAEK